MKARDILDEIDEFLSNESNDYKEREKLWSVLTALRGPDTGIEKVKFSTTSVIRKTAFPESFEEYDQDWENEKLFISRVGAFGASDSDSFVAFRKHLTIATAGSNDWHFRNHAQMAFAALNLLWESKN